MLIANNNFMLGKLKNIVIFTVLICGLVTVWNQLMPIRFISNYLWPLLGLFFLTTTVIFYVLHVVEDKDPKLFIQRFMLCSGLKMFLFLIIISVFLFVNKPEGIKFTLSFLSLYLVFTTFEVTYLLRNSK